MVTICTKKFCESSGPAKFLSTRRNKVADGKPFSNFNKGETSGRSSSKSSNPNIISNVEPNKALIENLKYIPLGANRDPQLKPRTSYIKRMNFAKESVGRKLENIYSTSTQIMSSDKSNPSTSPRRIVTAKSSKRGPSSKTSLEIKQASQLRPATVPSGNRQLLELKEMQRLLQKPSYVPKEKPIIRRPTLEVIKDAIEREKNKANDKNEGTSFVFLPPAIQSDASTNTKSVKKKKFIKKKQASPDSSSTKSISPSTKSKTKNKSQTSVKAKTGTKNKKTVVLRKRVNPKTAVSVGVQYDVQT